MSSSFIRTTGGAPGHQNVCLLLGCLMSPQHASVCPRRSFLNKFTFCHTEIDVAYLMCPLTESQCSDTRLTSRRIGHGREVVCVSLLKSVLYAGRRKRETCPRLSFFRPTLTTTPLMQLPHETCNTRQSYLFWISMELQNLLAVFLADGLPRGHKKILSNIFKLSSRSSSL